MKARLAWLLVAVASYFLYIHGLADVGVLSADEPRYASIGRDMWRSGDWLTPRLWGQPWFEKPALLYWLIAAGHTMGLTNEWAARLPVALVSLAFLLFYWKALRREFGPDVALRATGMLATSAGWLVYSHVAVTDLPMSACFGAAMLLAIRGSKAELNGAGALLGLAVLGKGLVPLVLALPLLWWFRKRLPALIVPIAILLAVAAPWYVLCYLKNGREFLDVLIVRHHFARVFHADAAILHPRPFWFYAPVLLAGLFPWTPVAVGLFQREMWKDARVRLFAAWLGFGFLAFSASSGKLPGYLLPLLPAATVLLAIGSDKLRWTWTAAPILLILVTPVAIDILPQALNDRLTVSALHWPPPWAWLLLLPLLVFRKRNFIVAMAIGTIAVGVAMEAARPALENAVSARPLWKRIENQPGPWCVKDLRRSWEYGLNYYAGRALPECATGEIQVLTSDPKHCPEPPARCVTMPLAPQ